MCTLTYYPKPKSEDFILTFSRDEQPSRSSVDIVTDTERGLVYPKDTWHGGTWLAIHPHEGRFACLLNGAFRRHERVLPYRKSRGLVLLDSFSYTEPMDFFQNYDFEGIEPFTCIAGKAHELYEFRWDGQMPHFQKIANTQAHIWSSATLYDPSVQTRRAGWFRDFLNRSNALITATDVWDFHKTAKKEEPENGLLMCRPTGVRTVSISQINFSKASQKIDFQYNELENEKIVRHQFSFGNASKAVYTEGVSPREKNILR